MVVAYCKVLSPILLRETEEKALKKERIFDVLAKSRTRKPQSCKSEALQLESVHSILR
jgi:hypothetical protein